MIWSHPPEQSCCCALQAVPEAWAAAHAGPSVTMHRKVQPVKAEPGTRASSASPCLPVLNWHIVSASGRRDPCQPTVGVADGR